MDGHHGNAPALRTVAGLEEARDLRAAIDEALGADPVDERRLRDAVFTYVGAERDAGVSPGRVIVAITGLVEAVRDIPTATRTPLLRNVILWSVEAYFGHLGGDVFGRRAAPPAAGA